MVGIMTFNIRCSDVKGVTWQERRELVKRQILEFRPDSVGVQEAHTEWMDYLSKALGDEYDYVGVGREDGKKDGEFCAVFYLKEKYKAIESGDFWLSKTPDKPTKGWDAACKRVCTFVRLKDRQTGKEYVHINTHFDHRGRRAQTNSVELIHNKALEYKELPVIFTGDLNILEGKKIYQKIVSSVLKDSKYIAPDSMNYLTFHNAQPEKYENHIIDYILINDLVAPKKYRVLSEGIDGQFVSDHYPVYMECEI